MSIEVLEVGQPTLAELAATINREHSQAQESAVDALRHAICAGEALLEVRQQFSGGSWKKWTSENIELGEWAIRTYIRLARYQHVVLDSPGVTTITEARALLVGLPRAHDSGGDGGGSPYPPEVRERAVALRAGGMTYTAIAETLDVRLSTIRAWAQPGYRAKSRERQERRKKQRRHERRALIEAERQQAITKALVKAGEATNEAHRLSTRLNDVLAQARSEAPSKDARVAINEAHAARDKMMDALVRALGVS